MRMAAALASWGSSSTKRELDARRAAGQPIGRPHLAEAVLACPANAARLDAGEHRRRRLADQGLPDRGPPRLPPAPDAHRGRGRPGDPRRRRRGRVGAPLLGRLGPARGARHDRPLPRAVDRRRGGLLHHPHPRADTSCWPSAARPSACSAPARPTSTGLRTASSPAFSRSTPMASSPTWGRSRRVSPARSSHPWKRASRR